MKTRLYYLLIGLLFLVACHADPGVISDDDSAPTLPGQNLECDSISVPNNIFPTNIGDVLVFTDSLGTTLDTLICSKNEAWSEKLTDNNLEYCNEHFIAAYKTKWLLSPDVYSFEFDISKSILTFYKAQSVPQEDFYSNFISSPNSSHALDSIVLNGLLFENAILYECLSSKPCLFLEAVVTTKDAGLVAYKRKGKWWTKI